MASRVLANQLHQKDGLLLPSALPGGTGGQGCAARPHPQRGGERQTPPCEENSAPDAPCEGRQAGWAPRLSFHTKRDRRGDLGRARVGEVEAATAQGAGRRGGGASLLSGSWASAEQAQSGSTYNGACAGWGPQAQERPERRLWVGPLQGPGESAPTLPREPPSGCGGLAGTATPTDSEPHRDTPTAGSAWASVVGSSCQEVKMQDSRQKVAQGRGPLGTRPTPRPRLESGAAP